MVRYGALRWLLYKELEEQSPKSVEKYKKSPQKPKTELLRTNIRKLRLLAQFT